MKDMTKIDTRIEQFKAALSEGVQRIKDACDIYVECIDADPECKAVYMSRCPDIPANAWRQFEAVGRGSIDQRLLYGGGPASARIKRLPLSEQKKVLDSGVEYLTPKGETLIVRYEDLSTDIASQVFDRDSVRSLGAQRALIESRKRDTSPLSNSLPRYEMKGDKLHVYEPTKISKEELKRMLLELV